MDYVVAGLGGIGLFLIGMWLITDGLKMAAGPSLEHLLARWTSSRPRALGAGILLTALVQSSSVITVAVIGFVSAGLMTFKRAVWVIFGSNLGTTLTVWLVALIGFRFRIDVFALPIIGFGALLRVVAPSERPRFLGTALAGFGLLFLGIDTLADGFSSLSETVSLEGQYSLPVMILLGLVLTALMMSSAAVITLALTALVGGMISFNDAIGIVIGANIGTTSTAVLAMIGATSPARRLALMHVLFNVITASFILLLLQPVLNIVLLVGHVTGQQDEPSTLLALFHFLFSLIGVLLMWPLEPWLSRQLQKLFRANEAREETFNYLDKSLLTVPDTIPTALHQELHPLLEDYPHAIRQLQDRHTRQASAGSGQWRRQKLTSLGEFFVAASRSNITETVADTLSLGWRIQHSLLTGEDALREITGLFDTLEKKAHWPVISPRIGCWLETLADHLQRLSSGTEGALDFMALFPSYEALKDHLLQATMAGEIDRDTLEVSLQLCSLSRRLAEQWLRARDYWQRLQHSPHTTEDSPTSSIS